MAGLFFLDETDLKLARALAEIREGVLYPGHNDLPQVPRGTHDPIWLPVIGSLGLVVITRDARIRYRPIEKARWIDHRVRGFVLTGRTSQSTDQSLALLTRWWTPIGEVTIERPIGPWMYSITNSGIRQLVLVG